MFSRRVIVIHASRRWETHAFNAIFSFWGKMRFGGHNFGFRRARRSIKGCIDSDDHLVSKQILSHKIDSLDWRPGPVKVGQTLKNTRETTDWHYLRKFNAGTFSKERHSTFKICPTLVAGISILLKETSV